MNNQNLNEALDINAIQAVLTTLKKSIPKLDVASLIKNAPKIVQAVKELAALDAKQNVSSLSEAKKPILLPFFNKYGLLIGGVAMAILAMVGSPPELPGDYIIKMITLGLQGKTAVDFFGSLNGYQGAELAADVFTGIMEDKKYSSFKKQQLLVENFRNFVQEEPSEFEGAELDDGTPVCPACLEELLESQRTIIQEAKYQGRTVTLNKPMKGDVKKFKVYVKDPSTGNVKKVNFGDPNMRIKKSNPARRKSFRARHHCDTNPGPKTKARYWSCKKW